MNLEDAIQHCEEVANDRAGCCEDCVEEHRQLAEWLKDYKRLLEQTPLEKVLREIRGEVVKKMVDYNNTAAVTIDCAALDILDKHISGKEQEE